MDEKLCQIKSRIDELLGSRGRILVAIDGNCTAGKTTLARMLAGEYDCNVFHMDDFFLQPHQRTPERYGEIGGNVDYERFQEEVLLPLKSGEDFSYRPFDCKTLTFSAPVAVQPKKLNIIEGSYCLHPRFGEAYDLKIFLSVMLELQRQRVMDRPAHLHQPFFEKWIPMENRYFSEWNIPQHCDLVY